MLFNMFSHVVFCLNQNFFHDDIFTKKLMKSFKFQE